MYALLELGTILALFDTEKEAMEEAAKRCAVIKCRKTGDQLASGYSIVQIED